jgi:starvation-inducible outer membrane lipoprotein
MYGFQQNQVTIQNSLEFKKFSFLNNQEYNYKHVNLQNGKLWAMTQNNNFIFKSEINGRIN